ncbi:uncharacterized protein [Hoplias malabaricus]|uniref:uncharacterized protein n=1 Tax=Hoplias malabaricus TaxID=27720 RepID=UPI0034632BA8
MLHNTVEDDPNKYQPEIQPLTLPFRKKLRYFTVVAGKTLNSDVEFKKRLQEEVSCLEEVSSEGECDLILLFCPVASRAGTNIEAALVKLRGVSDSKPAVLVMLHYTFKQDVIPPDSWRSVTRKNTLTVDCLFNEDRGLLTCSNNHQALQHIKKLVKVEGPKLPKPFEGNQFRRRAPTPDTAHRPQTKATTSIERPAESVNEVLEKQMNVFKESMKRVEQRLEEEEKKHGNKSFTNMIPVPKLRLVLVGKTGSAVEHMILDREERSQAGASCQSGQGQLAGREMTVVDTPEKLRDNKELMDSLTAQEPHAFLLVIPENQAIEEARNMVEKMEEIFGERCWRKAMVLFVITDEGLLDNEGPFDQEVQTLVEKCGNRSYIFIENGDGGQVSDLLESVDQMSGNRSSSEIWETPGWKDVRKKVSYEMLGILKNNDKLIQAYENDLLKLREKENNTVDNFKLITGLKTECEIKKRIWVRIRSLYERLSELGEDRDFIKVVLPGEQQILWLSVPSKEPRNQTEEELKTLEDLFFSKEMGSNLNRPRLQKE